MMVQKKQFGNAEEQAALLAQYISAQQSGKKDAFSHASNDTEIDVADKSVADELIRLAQTNSPAPEFAAKLEAQLLQLSKSQLNAEESEELGAEHSYLEDSSFGLPKEWAKIGSTIKALISKLPSHPLRQRFVWRPAMAITALAILSFCFLFAIPSTQASLSELLYGLTFVREEKVEEAVVPIIELSSEPQNRTLVALEELLQEAPFVTYLPGWLPPPLTFTNGDVTAMKDGVQLSLIYHPEPLKVENSQLTPNTPHLLFLISYGENELSPMLAVSELQFVMVDHQPAVFVRGNWRTEPEDSVDGTLDNLRWDASLDILWLSWERGGLNYLLYADGLGLERTDLIQVGNLMTKIK